MISCLDYVPDPDDTDRGTLVYGDAGGSMGLFQFSFASTQLFNDPVSQWDDPVNIHVKQVNQCKHKQSNVTLNRYKVCRCLGWGYLRER